MATPITAQSPLVLGSGSPRRREILTQIGLPFVVRSANADEGVYDGELPDAYLTRVVLVKLAAVRATLDDALAAAVLVCDTSVIAHGKILGKPRDEADSRAMIEALAGGTHDVKTRFAIAPVSGAVLHEETVVTRVTFRAVSAREAAAYAATGEGMDKAGGYAVQGGAAQLVSRIDGSYSNVVGLPACELVVALTRLGLLRS